VVVCSSLRRAEAPPGIMETLVATPEGAWIARHPELSNPPHGTGDMLAALLLGHTILGKRAHDALRLAISTVWSIIAASADRTDGELALVDARDNVTAPRFSAEIEQVA
jgi:pyridoxine kinase